MLKWSRKLNLSWKKSREKLILPFDKKKNVIRKIFKMGTIVKLKIFESSFQSNSVKLIYFCSVSRFYIERVWKECIKEITPFSIDWVGITKERNWKKGGSFKVKNAWREQKKAVFLLSGKSNNAWSSFLPQGGKNTVNQWYLAWRFVLSPLYIGKSKLYRGLVTINSIMLASRTLFIKKRLN